jgi:exocyst complex component 2
VQATLEVEFFNREVGRYVTKAADGAFAELYEKISKAYQRRSEEEQLGVHLENVKRILAEARRATAVEFMCFREARPAPRERVASAAKTKAAAGTPSKSSRRREDKSQA